MNNKTAKLLRSYARSTGKPIKHVKREWLTTPSTERGAVRAAMIEGLWSTELREWRAAMELHQKEAAAVLFVPVDTYFGWETMRATPPKFVRVSLGTQMRKLLQQKKDSKFQINNELPA